MNEETGPKFVRVTQENLEVIQALAGDAYETAIPSILRALATEAGISTEGAPDALLRQTIRKNAQEIFTRVEVIETDQVA